MLQLVLREMPPVTIIKAQVACTCIIFTLHNNPERFLNLQGLQRRHDGHKCWKTSLEVIQAHIWKWLWILRLKTIASFHSSDTQASEFSLLPPAFLVIAGCSYASAWGSCIHFRMRMPAGFIPRQLFRIPHSLSRRHSLVAANTPLFFSNGTHRAMAMLDWTMLTYWTVCCPRLPPSQKSLRRFSLVGAHHGAKLSEWLIRKSRRF